MNVIEVVLDCAAYNRIEETEKHPSPMPFLMSLKKDGTWFTEYHSQGPYTESAVMGLIFGKDTLNESGYFSSFYDWNQCLFKQFKDAGYDVFTTYFYSFMPKEVRTECGYSDSSNYGMPYFSRFLRGKLDYYYAVYKEKGKLREEDYLAIMDLMDHLFEIMVGYYTKETLKSDHTICAFEKRSEEQIHKIEKWRQKVSEEYTAFKESPWNYVNRMFQEYDTHFLTRKCDLFISPMKKAVVSNRQYIAEQKKFFRNLYFMKLHEYLFSNRPDGIAVCNHLKGLFKREEWKKSLEYFARFVKASLFYNREKMTSAALDQLASSARNDFESFLDWEENREGNRPFYAYIHVDDYHGESTLCSYDSENRDLIKRELEDARKFAQAVSPDYKGDIVKDCSLHYLDGCIRFMFEELGKRNLREKTIVVITADHGSANAGGTFRYTNTNNFYQEQYHPLLYIYGKEKGKIERRYIDGKDIPVTILDMCQIEKPENYTGVSAFGEKARDHTYVEYMGTGIPDLLRKPILFSYRDHEKSYVIGIKLFEDADTAILSEYYDLIADPRELTNLKQHYQDQAEKLLAPFADRLAELRQNYNAYIKGLRELFPQAGEEE